MSSDLSLDRGRVQQKLRTRRELLGAARRLMERKQPVTVAAAAAEANISKATAYRYFAASDILVMEAVLDGDWGTPETVIGDAHNVRERVLRVHDYFFEFTRKNEVAYRLYLAKTMEAWVAEGGVPKTLVRGARRLPMFEKALEPVRRTLSPKHFKQLVSALSAATGLETYIVLKDVCRLSDAEAHRVATGMIEAILEQALLER